MSKSASFQELLARKHWVFDMDGTLTIAMHDFDAIRAEFGLPEGLPILESLDALPKAQADDLHQRLTEIEYEVAMQSKAAQGAPRLLRHLSENGANLGILTRNTADNIAITLEAAGLLDYFERANLLSRDCAIPKPQPDGVFKLMQDWNASAEDTIMVGDHQHDLLAGSRAGVHTLYVDPGGEFIFGSDADTCILSFEELFEDG